MILELKKYTYSKTNPKLIDKQIIL